jgi:hypothetical protein
MMEGSSFYSYFFGINTIPIINIINYKTAIFLNISGTLLVGSYEVEYIISIAFPILTIKFGFSLFGFIIYVLY